MRRRAVEARAKEDGEGGGDEDVANGGEDLDLQARGLVEEVVERAADRRYARGEEGGRERSDGDLKERHGEEDEFLKRGRPLFLSERRYRALEDLWVNGALDYDTLALHTSRVGSDFY